MKFILFYLIILLGLNDAFSQSVKGSVVELNSSNEEVPLPGASVYWINTTVGTITNLQGVFEITSENISDKRLLVSYVGYQNDTIAVTGLKFHKVTLQNSLVLKTALVIHDSEKMRSMETKKTEIISSIDLKKAACCNLGESFETNATVDVTIKDAVSGSTEIQVLGLSGSYTQLLTENAPLLRGLGLTHGLYGVPGTQIAMISIVKGPGSVIFGHESISGMVNVDIKDPQKTDAIFLNAYLNNGFRKELNADFAHRFNKSLATLISVHGDHTSNDEDMNSDGFMDMPRLTNINLLNKWKFTKNSWISQNSIKVLYEQRGGGQTNFDFSRTLADSTAYGQNIETRRFEFYGRTGYVLPTKKYSSIGFQYSIVNHEQDGFFGMDRYSGLQELLELKLIHSTSWSENNNLNSGLSYNRHFSDERFRGGVYLKNENVPGLFLENTFQKEKWIAFILGVRADYLAPTTFVTPRANVKYSFSPQTDLRVSAGTGWKTSDLLAENPNLMASSRIITVTEKLNPEQAVNYGLDFTHRFTLDYRKGSFGIDIYRTEFTNKIIPDLESDSTSTKVIFSNLKGKSYSNNFQANLEYELIKNTTVKISYKYLDVFQTNNGIKIIQPLISRHRVFANIFYESFSRKWNTNATLQYYGEKRLPNTSNNPAGLQMDSYSKPYFDINAQFNRIFKDIEVYVGAENILAFIQKDAIIDSENPYSPYFDTGNVWGPLDGRKIYIGIRLKIK